MLQQTQVGRVLDRFGPFLDRFSSPAACAASPVGDVIGAWAGLGYNRRAVSLHRCATEVVRSHDGQLPDRLEALLALPGIGPYTARAVLAFAFEDDVGIVDTNVARILARQHGRRFRASDVQRLADELVPDGHGWSWNQAMLDLGATVCRARSAACDRCPVASTCSWRGSEVVRDPAIGSAGVSGGQSTFVGSDRQGRGRLVDALRADAVGAGDLAEVMGWPDEPDRAVRVANGLVRDGLAVIERGQYRLPQ